MAITPLKIRTIEDTPSRIVRNMRDQWNKLVDDVAALDASTATAEDVVNVLQGLSKIVCTIERPPEPVFPDPEA